LVEKSKTNNKYSPEMTQWVYAHLLELARTAIESGFPVVIDATFLKKNQRHSVQGLAKEMAVEFQIVDCHAPYQELCRRIRDRGADPSEATLDILKMQTETHDPLTTDELPYVSRIGPTF
jgi:predicted kinase